MDKQPQPSEQPTTAPDPGNGGTGAQTVTVPVMQSDSNGTAPAATNGISAGERLPDVLVSISTLLCQLPGIF